MRLKYFIILRCATINGPVKKIVMSTLATRRVHNKLAQVSDTEPHSQPGGKIDSRQLLQKPLETRLLKK